MNNHSECVTYVFIVGVDSLLNLVVELYKQQKTIKAFETSVRSLRHDILKELNVPHDQKGTATARVRDESQKTARDRLHGEYLFDIFLLHNLSQGINPSRPYPGQKV